MRGDESRVLEWMSGGRPGKSRSDVSNAELDVCLVIAVSIPLSPGYGESGVGLIRWSVPLFVSPCCVRGRFRTRSRSKKM